MFVVHHVPVVKLNEDKMVIGSLHLSGFEKGGRALST